MSKVTPVEMTIGLESLESQKLDPAKQAAKLAEARKNDRDKLAIANSMHVRWLTYPTNRSDDFNYSRADLTLRSDNFLEWEKAKTLEDQLELLGISKKGDAQQVVACAYGRAEDDGLRPAIRWLLSEDRRLREALKRAKAANKLHEFAQIQVNSAEEFSRNVSKEQW